MYKMVKRKQLVPVRNAPEVPTPVAPPRLRRGMKKKKEEEKPKAKPKAKAKAPAKPKAPKAPKKLIKPNVMKRIQKKVAKLGKEKALEKRKVGRGVAKEAKIMTKEAKAKAKEEKAKAKPKAKAKKLSKTLINNLNAYLRSLVKSYAGKSTESDDEKNIALQKKIGIRGGTDEQAQSIIDILKSRNDVFDYYSKLPDNTRFRNSPTSYLDSILRDFAYNKKEAGMLSGYQSRFS